MKTRWRWGALLPRNTRSSRWSINRPLTRASVFPCCSSWRRGVLFREIVPVSATKGDNLEALQRVIVAHLPVGEALFPSDQL